MKKRIPPIFAWSRRFVAYALVIFIVCHAVNYLFEARSRMDANKNPERWWIESKNVGGIAYTARMAFLNRDTILLRLYESGDPALLAERSFTEHGVQVRWTPQELIYDTSDDSFLGGGIQLPPTRLDRFLARIP